MTPRAAFWKWFVIAGLVSIVLVVTQGLAVGGLEGLLQVGETSTLRPIIEAELGEVPLAEGPGHDGQIYYAIGLDLSGDVVGPLLDHGAYRYRRILYPLVASGFGLLGGTAFLYGLVIVAVVSVSVAAALVAQLAVRNGRREWWALLVVLNPGVWLSIRLLTGDGLAIALMVWAVSVLYSKRDGAAWIFSLSALTKDVFLATPIPLGIARRHWRIVLIPIAVMVGWMTWLTITIGDGFAPRGNIDLPLVGIIDAIPNWSSIDGEDWFYLIFALASVFGGLVVALLKKSDLRWSILAWSGLGLISSAWVWDFGNNAARAFA
ncbi:MAG: hypothetical protein WBM90_06925, partial [Acidimicrobiia bacterium]